MSYVYFIGAQVGNDIICKIGFTRRHPRARMNDLQPCSPVEIDIFGYVKGGQDLERKFHRTFAALRLHGEWFHAVGKLKDFMWYLAGYGAANRVTTAEELDAAIWDCILADSSNHPSISDEEYMASADMSEWRELLEA